MRVIKYNRSYTYHMHNFNYSDWILYTNRYTNWNLSRPSIHYIQATTLFLYQTIKKDINFMKKMQSSSKTNDFLCDYSNVNTSIPKDAFLTLLH